MATTGLTSGEILRITNRWIGVDGGYLGDFSYATHREFYPEYCELDEIDADSIEGTTRQRFIAILTSASPSDQAQILAGVLEKYPPGSEPSSGSQADRSETHAEWIRSRMSGLHGAAVPAPVVEVTSDVVRRALNDAQLLIAQSGPESAIDRVHTALHGHLRFICDAAQITHAPNATVTQLFKLARTEHPSLRSSSAAGEISDRILRPMATVIDELNSARNNRSLSHPTDQLLGPAEASLAVDAARTILRYLDNRIQFEPPRPAEDSAP